LFDDKISARRADGENKCKENENLFHKAPILFQLSGNGKIKTRAKRKW